MNINPSVSSTMIRTVKSEPGHYTTNSLKNDLIKQKEEYEGEISRLRKTHNEQICKLCTELEKSSAVLHQYKMELDSMRMKLNIKENQIKNKTNESSTDQILQTKNLELITENTKLKKELSVLTTQYQTLASEMQDARQYVLKMITSLD